MTDLRQALESGILICDGAMGTMLHAAGNSLDQALPALNLTDAALVRTIHDSYVDSGADIVQTNTFGASRLRLAAYGFGDRVEEINRAGVRLAREAAAAADRPVLVAGSVSPAVNVQQRRRAGAAERRDALAEQLSVLDDAGVDLVLLETFGYLDELVEAVEVAAGLCRVPVIAQATFASDTHTLSGHTPREVASALAGTPIVALGTNCTLGPQRSLAVLRALSEHTDLPLTVQPNAGLPRRVAPARFEYDIDSEYFVRYVRQLLEAGARIVGGCCGTTPTQLAAIVQAAEEYRRRPLTVTPREEPAPARPAPVRRAPFGDRFIVELTPPPTGGGEETLDMARRLMDDGIGLISVVASRTARAQLNPIDLALHLHQTLGVDTMATVTTWDRTIMALQADLLGAHTLGLRRVVCETGSPPLLGDYPHVDGIWDVDSLGLIELLADLNNGDDYYGLRLPSKTEFEIGARVNPGSREPEREAARAAGKIAAGARFLITRPVYDPADLERLLDLVARQTSGREVPVLAAVHPLTGFPEAELLAHEVPDVRIPDRTLAALQDAGDGAREVGIELALDLVSRLKEMAGGIVLAPTTDPVETVHAILSGT
ncbi:bifunctional homocysteine S-methyltransferase/methylenetetrahydrofolate reductase [Actinomadura sp. NBRC 104412]|uniref:bifunctional homocysteine S-methyltransferase/methylenetetrahydrofolate reductase n=1 Tax=Actinomadura sp. NBRC 104412 TaxID=3032203 RepID=UPI0024A5A748|nr:bifunctional homocysteine S-methyltransferase/methylenetetrahydrofolate reductase [Actinomadura sp. NBRC 104412]GLZ02809.1 bifunctional homocysteine S-methyltransferase/methylenetetrahydrofolate reductase [Actinomadura sp. NBRC 104412]